MCWWLTVNLYTHFRSVRLSLVQCRICLVFHAQNKVLHLFEPLFNCSTSIDYPDLPIWADPSKWNISTINASFTKLLWFLNRCSHILHVLRYWSLYIGYWQSYDQFLEVTSSKSRVCPFGQSLISVLNKWIIDFLLLFQLYPKVVIMEDDFRFDMVAI
jgi:hypothetical protein